MNAETDAVVAHQPNGLRDCCPAHARADGEAIWHAAQPGPAYWDWRCLRCSQPVNQHASWWRRLVRRLSSPPGQV